MTKHQIMAQILRWADCERTPWIPHRALALHRQASMLIDLSKRHPTLLAEGEDFQLRVAERHLAEWLTRYTDGQRPGLRSLPGGLTRPRRLIRAIRQRAYAELV